MDQNQIYMNLLMQNQNQNQNQLENRPIFISIFNIQLPVNSSAVTENNLEKPVEEKPVEEKPNEEKQNEEKTINIRQVRRTINNIKSVNKKGSGKKQPKKANPIRNQHTEEHIPNGKSSEESLEYFFDFEFFCKKCDDGFMKKTQLTKHLKTHKKFKCPLDRCEKSFIDSKSLLTHVRNSHLELLAFFCQVHGKSYKALYGTITFKFLENLFGEKSTLKMPCQCEGCLQFYPSTKYFISHQHKCEKFIANQRNSYS